MTITRKQKITTTMMDAQSQYAANFVKDGGETYEERVRAKRARNQEVLEKSGLLRASATMWETAKPVKVKVERGLKRRVVEKVITPRRKSSRLSGVQAKHHFVDTERNGKITVGGTDDIIKEEQEEDRFYNGRVNDGSDLTLDDAVQLCGEKWRNDDTVNIAKSYLKDFVKSSVPDLISSSAPDSISSSIPDLISSDESSNSRADEEITSQIAQLKIDDASTDIAKVTPDRIYAITAHPSPHTMLACAGDKSGHVGLWNVDSVTSYLFRPHSSVVTHLEWNLAGTSLLSASYDGSVREFDLHSQTFKEIFATYDDSSQYNTKLGSNLDEGWIQYVCRDKQNDDCLLACNSKGAFMRADLRCRTVVKHYVSEKKLNTVSQHPHAPYIATAGLDTLVRLFDLRNMSKVISHQQCGRSVSSAFFSPSGKHLLATTMSDNLTITTDAHLNQDRFIPNKIIKHDNHTGRWLSTFMARWHPHNDIFVVGSMNRPRQIDVFDKDGAYLRGIQGEGLGSVMSRCCFHESTEKMVIFGGNSSGKVCVLKS